MMNGSPLAFGDWRRGRRSLVVLVVGALLASLLAVAPVDVAGAASDNFGEGTRLSVEITDPLDGAAVGSDEVTLRGAVEVGAGEAADQSIVIVMDITSSMNRSAGVDCTGNGVIDNMFACQVEAAQHLIESAAEVGSVAEMGLVVFGSSAVAADVSPEPGIQRFAAPDADVTESGVPDLLEVLATVRVDGGFDLFDPVSMPRPLNTNYEVGAARACEVMSAASTPNRTVVFISDGDGNAGNALRVVPCESPAVFETFGIGASVRCGSPTSGRSLEGLAAATGGTCTHVEDLSQLERVLGGLVRPEILGLELSVNGGDPIDISGSLAEPLPATGPVRIEWEHLVTGLDQPSSELCVTVRGRLGAEVLEVPDCIEVVSNEPPVADAGGDLVVVEGSLVTLDGSGSFDPDGDPLSYGWSLVSVSGPPVVLSSVSEPQVSFLALDDGEYVLELAVSDGRATSTDRARVTVQNAAPVVGALVGSGVGGGGVTLLSGTFTDPGPLDVHSATVDWGDGSGPVPVEVSNQGTGWGSVYAAHSYAVPGAYAVTLTVVDDDGGEATVEVGTAEVEAPMAVWATGSDSRSISISGASSTIRGRSHANGGVRTAGTSHGFEGLLTYVGPLSLAGAHHEFDPEPQQVGPADPPVELSLEDYRPGGRAAVVAGASYFDMSGACGSTWSPDTVLEPGLYWAPCDVHIAGAHVFAGPVTIAAEGSIRVTGAGGEFFEPFVDGALFVAGAPGADAVRVAGAGSTFVGFVQAEGEIHINGSGHRFVCGMVGDSIRIAGSGTTVEGADCAAPDRTAVAPTVVPGLYVDYTQTPGEVSPGDVLAATVTVTNSGARLVAPAVAGVENLSDTSLAVASGEVTLEYLPAGSTGWVPLGVPVEISTRALPASGVGAPTGADPFAGVSVEAGSTALWAVEVTATIDPATMAELLDPAVVAGLRVVTDLGLDPVGVPVRRLVRFGPDLVDDIRADGGVITDAEALVVLPDGRALRVTPAEVPGLAELAAGATAAESFEVTVPVPAGPGAMESADAYVARLAVLDDTLLAGGAFAYGTGGPGRLLAPMTSDSSTRRVPVVAPTVSGSSTAAAGDELVFDVGLANQGSASAGELVVTATVGGEPVEVTGLGDTLAAGGLDTGTIAVAIPADADTGVLDLEVTIAWSGANGTAYGPITVDHDVEVTAGAALGASMRWFLHTDNTGNGLPSPGDVIRYEATIVNRGDSPATGVAVELPLDPASVLVAGSATATDGLVSEDDDTVLVTDATIAAGGQLVVSALVEIPADVDDAVRYLEAQATISADGVDPVVSDDPARFGTNQPTRTHLVRLVPALYLISFESLRIDADGNGVASSGDTLAYVAEVYNGGTGVATGVSVTFDADPDTTIAAATSTAGEVTIGDGQVIVEVGNLTDEVIEIRVDVVIGSDLAAGTELVAEWAVDAGNVAGTPITEVVNTELGAPVGPGAGPEGPGAPGSGLPTGGTADIAGLTPADGGVVTAPTEVSVGGITPTDGGSITEWILTTYPAGVDPGDGVTLGEGTGDPSDTTLGTFDPTTRANGIWTVRLEVTDSAGAVSFAESGLVVDGQLKLGRYVVTYEDMAVPVAGIPIQVLRTYDTLNKDSEGDFGFGWNLELANFRVQTNRTLGLGPWTGQSCGAGLIFVPLCFTPGSPRFVTVTWPDGRTETFDLTPTGNTFFATTMVPEYTPRAGATSTLSPAPGDTTGGRGGDGHMRTGGFGDGPIYDPQRFVLTARDGTEYLLDRDAGLVSATDRNGNTITVTPEGITSSSGPGIAFERDSQGRIDAVVGPDGSTVAYGYDEAGDLVAVTDPNNNTTDHVYEDHYLVETLDPTGAPWRRLDYDPDTGQLAGITDANGHTTTITTDLGARTQVVTSPDGRLTTISSFDERGNEIVRNDIFDGTSHPTTFAYSDDGLDLITSRTDPEGNTWSGDYNTRGDLVRFVDAENHETLIDYDGFGFPTLVRGELGTEVVFGYDDFGNLARLEDPEGRERTWTHDGRGYPLTYSDELGLRRSWSYTPTGLVESMTDGLGTTTYSYDNMGRLVGEARPEGPVTYSYDTGGRLETMTDPTGVTTFVYDDTGRITEVTSAAGTITYSYDDAGRLTGRTTPHSTTAYSYDPAGRLTALNDTLAGEVTYTHTWGGVETITRPNGVITINSYDLAGRLTRIDHSGSEGLIDYFDYTLNDNGHPLAVESNAGVETYVLDALNRLVEVTYPGGDVETFAYNRAGDRLQSTFNGEITTYSYDDAGQLIEAIGPDGPIGFTWDDNGNLVETTAGDSYTWTSTNMMASAQVGTISQTYTYDASDVRVGVDGEPWLWDPRTELPELIHDGLAVHIEGEAVFDGALRWHLGDRLGSVRSVVDSSGSPLTSMSYRAYGEAAGPDAPSSGAGFTGEFSDPTGLVHLRSRQYAPALGVFLSRDSLQPNALGTGGFNQYAYAAGGPTIHSDPSGQSVVGEYLTTFYVRGQTYLFTVQTNMATGISGAVGYCLKGVITQDTVPRTVSFASFTRLALACAAHVRYYPNPSPPPRPPDQIWWGSE